MPNRPLIAAIGCGGTISSLGRDSMDVLDYPDFGTKLPIDQVLARYPEIATVADVMPVPFRSVGAPPSARLNGWSSPSSSIGSPPNGPSSPALSFLTARRPLEEMAYFLHLALKNKTVVAVGAQRPASAFGSDAGMNLL